MTRRAVALKNHRMVSQVHTAIGYTGMKLSRPAVCRRGSRKPLSSPGSMLQRRDLLKLTAGGLAALGGVAPIPGPALAQAPSVPEAPPSFSFGNVVDLARALAKRPFQAAATDL